MAAYSAFEGHSGFPQFLPPQIGHLPPLPVLNQKYISPGNISIGVNTKNQNQLRHFVGATNCPQFLQYACCVMITRLH